MAQSGTREMFIYSPYWFINKTGLHVEYKVSEKHSEFLAGTDTALIDWLTG